jgi:hypothetical protein
MKPAFSTATTAPTTGKKDPMDQNQTNTNHNLIVFSKPSSMSPVSVHDVPVSTRCRRRMRGALYEICAIYRRWSESARRRANDVRVKRPLIRLRHLLPQLKSAGGEGLSIERTPENEPLALD